MEFMITFIFWVNVGIVALFCSAFILGIVQSYKTQKLKNSLFSAVSEEDIAEEKKDN